MQYVPFGNHGFDVSRLGFGCMRLPTLEQDGVRVIDEPEAIRMIRTAIDNGVNYVDTAYPYHDGKSELVVGKALKDGYRERVKLTTKLPLWKLECEADMDRTLDEQLKKLDVPYVDFYLMHAVSRGSFEKITAFRYKDFLRRALKDGRIKHAGFSFHDNKQTFFDVLHDFDEWGLAQIQFNYLDEQNQATVDGVREAGRIGVPIVVMEPLRGGALARPPKEVREAIESYPVRRSAIEWAFAYVADFPQIATILSGMSTMEQVEDNLRIFDRLTVNGLTDEDRKLISSLREAYLNRMPIGCTGCRYCQPCPREVYIPRIFGEYNESKMFDNPESFARRYARLAEEGHGADQCAACGACEAACPQHLNIIDLLQGIRAEVKN